MQPLNQYDTRWAGHALGAEPGELGPYGCKLVTFNMIAADAYGDMHYTPDKFDEVLYGAGVFNDDGLADYALDRVWPDRFETTHYDGARRDVMLATLPTPDQYVFLWLAGVYSPLWKMVINTHYVWLLSGDGWIADPAGGVVRSITAYGDGWSSVKATSVVRCKLLTPKPAPVVAPVVQPVLAPPAALPPPAPLAPTFGVRFANSSLLLAASLTFAAAVAEAHRRSLAFVGQLYEVVNEKGQVVETEYIAPPPAPVVLPPAPKPTPAPIHVQQPDFWGRLQNVLIQLLAPVAKRRGKF